MTCAGLGCWRVAVPTLLAGEGREKLPVLVAAVSHSVLISQMLQSILRTCPSIHQQPLCCFHPAGSVVEGDEESQRGPWVTRSTALFSSVSLRDACDTRVYCCASPSVGNKHSSPAIHSYGWSQDTKVLPVLWFSSFTLNAALSQDTIGNKRHFWSPTAEGSNSNTEWAKL